MINLDFYINFFKGLGTIKKEEETLDFYEIFFDCTKKPVSLNVDDFLKNCTSKDLFRLSLIDCNDSIYSFENTKIENVVFFDEFKEIDSDNYEISLHIEKNQECVIEAYNVDKLTSYLLNLKNKSLLELLNSRLNNHKYLIIRNDGFTSIKCLGRISFSNAQAINLNTLNHESSTKVFSTSKVVGIDNLRLIPEDLNIDDANKYGLKNKFTQLGMLLIVSSLFDYSYFDSNNLNVRLNGYKTFNFVLPVDMINTQSYNQYYKIFKWAFEGNNTNDKIGVIRNILSLNFIKQNDIELSQNCFDSILSGFKVYEKQNVKQYIELRNKISDQILSYNDKASKLIENFASSFQKSVLGFISLFSTIVITRVLTNKNFENIFTKDSLVITVIFLAISLIYLFISIWELNAQTKRYKLSYSNMKQRNSDLLNENDVAKILNNDKEYYDDLKFISSKKCVYIIFWIFTIIVFATTSFYLYYSKNNTSQAIELRQLKVKDTILSKPIEIVSDSLKIKTGNNK